jgi:hypothetical protein
MYDHNPFGMPGRPAPAGMTELFRSYMLANEGIANNAQTLYGASLAEQMMGIQQEKNERLNAQMNAIVLGPKPLETCDHCGKVRRLQHRACVDCYTMNRSRLWHLLYGLGLV